MSKSSDGFRKKEAVLPEHSLPLRRALLKGLGFTDQRINRPLVGVVNSWGENNPAARHIDGLAKVVKEGIDTGGATPMEFCISSLCGGMAGGGPGARYALSYRDIVAAFIEIMSEVNYLDALVLLPVCDDVVPAHLMAAARLNLPSILVLGGYMPSVHHNGLEICAFDVSSKYAEWKSGKVSDEEYFYYEDSSCQGFGSCPWMGTGNTMGAIAEALGMALPGNSTTCGSDPKLLRIAYEAGRQIVNLVETDIKPSRVMTKDAIHNAVKVCSALGGSSNAILHMPAIAEEADVEFNIDLFDRYSMEVPQICNVKPTGKYLLKDLDEAGGLPAVLKELAPLLNLDVLTITGRTLRENISSAKVLNREVIYPLSQPFKQMSGIVILKGNLAPRGAIVKLSGVAKELHTYRGRARVFNSEVEATNALLKGEINSGDVVVIRYLGPRGDPGMRVCARFLWILSSMPTKRVALVTDGRFSGTNKGLGIGHVSPEAAVGGPIALVKDNDIIEIDIPNRRLNIEISDEEIKRRKDVWKAPSPKAGKGYLTLMERLMQPPEKGATLKP